MSRDRCQDPQQPLSARALEWMQAKLAERGIDPDTPVTDTPEPLPALEAAAARIPYAFRDAAVEEPRVRAWTEEIVRLAEAPNRSARPQIAHGPSLLLVGPTGTGKTHHAFGAIRFLLASGVDVRWQAITAADLYGQMRPSPGTDPEHQLRQMVRIPLLVLDDLGAAKASEWTEELTYRLINQRWVHGLPTMITSNLSIPELRGKLGDRTASRIAGMSRQVALKGTDRRRAT